MVRALRYLLQTNHYERPFHPEVGGNISKLLFEPITFATTLRIKQVIKETINNWEPRVKVNEIIVEAKEDQNGYVIAIRFHIVNEEVERKTIFFLERSR